MQTYQAVCSFNKFSGLPDGVLNIDAGTFFGSSVGDPYILYDRFSQLWFSSCEPLVPSPSSVIFMVSSDSSITPYTKWNQYIIPPEQINPLGFPSGGFLDFQQPATDENAWYCGVGTFNGVGTFLGSSLAVIPKSSLLAGSPNITVFPGLFPEVIGIVQEGWAAPANNFDRNSTYGYFVWCIYEAPASNYGTTIQLYRILDAGTNNPSLGPVVTFDVPPFAFNDLFNDHKGNLYGAPGFLQNNLGRLATPHVRNKQLYLAQDIQIDSTGTANINGDRIGVRWYQFDLTGDPSGQGRYTETESTAPFLIQSGTLFDSSATNPLSYFLSSIMSNKNGDLVISANVAGKEAYVNACYAFRAASDPIGELRTPVLTTNTSFPLNYNTNSSIEPGPGVQRWGDESIVVIDPTDDLTFWLTQPYAALQNSWGMQATQLISAG